jgi:hypothetical protein
MVRFNHRMASGLAVVTKSDIRFGFCGIGACLFVCVFVSGVAIGNHRLELKRPSVMVYGGLCVGIQVVVVYAAPSACPHLKLRRSLGLSPPAAHKLANVTSRGGDGLHCDSCFQQLLPALSEVRT